MKSIVLFITLFLSCVVGHAVLRSPPAWNPNPSKTSPCGGVAPVTIAEASWVEGSKITVTWQIVAADGEGLVNATFDPTGTQTFATSGPLVQTIGTTSALGYYNFTLTVPTGVTCTGAGGLCMLQVKSISDWYSCATVQLSTIPVTTAAPPGPTCQMVNGLSFCSQLNGQYVLIPAGTTPTNLDAETASTYSLNYNNPNVFNNNSTACATAYKNFLCHNDFPYCGTTGACQSLCQTAITTCNVTKAEAGLYDCALGPVSCAYPGGNTSSPASLLKSFIELAMMIVLLLAML